MGPYPGHCLLLVVGDLLGGVRRLGDSIVAVLALLVERDGVGIGAVGSGLGPRGSPNPPITQPILTPRSPSRSWSHDPAVLTLRTAGSAQCIDFSFRHQTAEPP